MSWLQWCIRRIQKFAVLCLLPFLLILDALVMLIESFITDSRPMSIWIACAVGLSSVVACLRALNTGSEPAAAADLVSTGSYNNLTIPTPQIFSITVCLDFSMYSALVCFFQSLFACISSMGIFIAVCAVNLFYIHPILYGVLLLFSAQLC